MDLKRKKGQQNNVKNLKKAVIDKYSCSENLKKHSILL
jgi:hypothetical protein